ncbi:MAG: DUF6443 domain-containing protein [Saprospiraceae bacterium]
MKKYIFLAWVICMTNISIGQPSAPTVSGLGYAKFVEFPISPFTGTFSYSVPIATVTAGSLSLPVSIDYHSGGNRVGDPSSSVGLGWNLNYGGSIIRTIKGVADEHSSKGYRFNPTPNTESANAFNIADGDQDGEPDIYTWSAGGQGGKFYRDRNNNIISIIKTSAKIEMLFAVGIDFGFFITLDNGVKFIFTPLNNQTIYPGNSWPIIEYGLQKVISFDEKDSIQIFYKTEIAEFRTKYIAMPYKFGNSPTGLQTQNNTDIEYLHNERVIDQIIGTNNKITFITSDRNDLIVHNVNRKAKKIDTIKYENGSYCTEHVLTHEYFKSVANTTTPNEQSLKLKKIQKFDCSNSTSEPPIEFEYYGNTLSDGSQFFPSKLDKNIDHYGYYNKNILSDNNYGNVDMIQPTSLFFNGNQYNVGNANRSPDFESTVKGMLKKVTLPTKGNIEYTYESNEYLGALTNNSLFSMLRYCGTPCGAQNYTYTGTINTDIKNTGQIDITGVGYEDCDASNYNCTTQSPRFSRLRVYDSNNQLIYTYDLPIPAYQTTSATIYLSSISAITADSIYTFELEVENCLGYCSLLYQNQTNYIAPGVRIKQTKISDGVNTSNDIIKTYNYTKFTNNNQSSGFLVNTPKYGQSIQNSSYVVFSAYSLKSLFNIDGFGIGYENVTIDYNGIGKEKLTFHKELTTGSGKYPPEPNQTLIGRSLDNKSINEQGDLVSQSNLTYVETSNLSDFFHLAFKVTSSFAVLNPYKLKTNRFVSVTTEFSMVDGVSTFTNHTYNLTATPPILGPIESSITNSDEKITKTKTRYTSQYDIDNTTLTTDLKNAFISRNINIPYQVINEVDGNDLSGSRTEFNFYDASSGTISSSGNLIPRSWKELKYERTWNSSGVLQTGQWTTQKTYNIYGYKGKLTSFFDDGYNNTILGYDPNSYNLVSKTYDAHTTSYEYYPNSTLIKKVTDIDGTSVSYEYDNLLRLWKIIDNNKLITKTYSYYFGSGTSTDRHKTSVITTFQGANNTNSQLTTIEDITYYDNLERPIQIMKKGQSPTNKDVVTSMEYDKYGRVVKEYLPIEGTGSSGAFIAIQSTWKHNLTTYESSPLSRKLSTLPPDWYATTYEYGSNNTAIDGIISDPKTGYTYPQNSLFKILVIDPHNNKTISFTDKKGRAILSASYNGSTLASTPAVDKKITMPVYDLKDRTEAVVVPGATWGSTDLNFYYGYDGDDKMIYKKLPSRGEMHYVYNSKDLVAGMRDNNLGSSKWIATEYDNYGRSIKSGFALGTSINVNAPSFSELHAETIYGTTGIEKGKVKTDKTVILGTTNWLQTSYSYDATTGRVTNSAGNHHLNTGNTTTGLTSSYIYDKGGNVTNTNTGIIAAPGGSNLPVNHIDKYDHVGRNTENIFQYNGGTATTLSKQIYNHREELVIKYQGGTGLTGHLEYLQEINYGYLTNGLLSTINQNTTGGSQYYNVCSTPNPSNYGTYDDKDLFYLKLYYDQDPISLFGGGYTRKNGEISHALWQVKGRALQTYRYFYDHHGQMTNAAYYEPDPASWGLIGFTNRYSESAQYDLRGNITAMTRYGVASPTTCGTAVLIDQMTYNYSGQTGNRVHSISDAAPGANGQLGFKPAAGNYSYDANGNITADPYKDISSIEYNHFDKPTRINKSNGWYITFTYDGSGGMLTKSIFNNSNILQEKRDYIGNFEYVGGVLESVMHSEGRYRSVTAKHEYAFKDHLGNTRLVYSDTNNDGIITVGTEVLQESHYYPFGLEFQGHYIQQSGFDYRYKYNDIERLKDLDVGIDMAFYRGLDPTTGRWMQVDPKAEAMGSMSPYCAMNNNPASNVDPDGDLPQIIIGAAIGAIYGGITNGWEGAWKGALVGAVGGAVPQIGFVSSLGNIGSGAITGAITGGLNAGLNNQDILKGFGVGAAIGAGVGLVQDGIQNAKEVKAARRDLIASGYDPNGSVSMTNEDFKKFVQAHGKLNSMYNQSGLPDLYAGTPPSFSGYEIDSDGLFLSPSGNKVAGVTRQLNKNISIHVAPGRFTKAIKLYTTVGHELNHAVDFFNGSFAGWSAMGGQNFARNISEYKAHTWSLNVGKQVSFETSRHRAALSLYSSQMTNRDWINFFKLYGL